MVKISVIMPVYNCEQFLEESINSVLNQTLQEWELLCVDDGSTDNSLEILKEYQQRDKRIKVYAQENQGAGVARNLALEYAQGEYVAFLDADDYYYDAEALEEMYHKCEVYKTGACGSVIKLYRNGVIAEDSGFKQVRNALREKDILDYQDFQLDYGYYGFIYKLKILKQNHIFFPPYRRFQDPPFFVKAMHKIERFSFIEKSLYCYRTPTVAVRFNYIKTLGLLKGLIENLEYSVSNNLELLFARTLQRIEVEYSNIICHNISGNSTEMLELLLKANQIVKNFLKKEDYVIVPLQNIFNSVVKSEQFAKSELLRKMNECEKIYIYGAGNATKDFCRYLEKQGLKEKVVSIIVTSKEGNPEEVDGIPVISINKYQYTEGDLVLITVTSIYRAEIMQKLEELQMKRYEAVDVGMFF